jgi:hypothetical protein
MKRVFGWKKQVEEPVLWDDDVSDADRVRIVSLKRAWNGIRQRCNNPNNPSYKNYGGRGIKMHPPWEASFELFMEDVGLRPRLGLSLDRVDNNGNYEPENVRWATPKQQQNNKVGWCKTAKWRERHEAGRTGAQVS